MVASSLVLSGYIGTLSIVFALATYKFHKMIKNLESKRPVDISALPVGVNSHFYGQVYSLDGTHISAPYSHSACLGYVANVEQKISHLPIITNDVNSSHYGSLAHWDQIGSSSHLIPFLIKDKTGSICVIAPNAQLSLSQTLCGEIGLGHLFKPVKFGFRWLVRRFSPIHTLWAKESLLSEGDFVYVSGTVKKASISDRQMIPAHITNAPEFVVRGLDISISSHNSFSNISYLEKSKWFCMLSAIVSLTVLVILILPPIF